MLTMLFSTDQGQGVEFNAVPLALRGCWFVNGRMVFGGYFDF